MEPKPSAVCYALRKLKRQQVSDSSMGRAVLDFITSNNLVTQTSWPAYVIRISEAGYEYLAEHDAE
jgi:hypothetical protein